MTPLPIHAVLPALLAALDAGSNAVLVAPPGAGKTTAVAPALLDRPWCTGRVLLLSPRRIAARAAAERIAELAGEKIGGRIGYATRLDSRQSAATRLLVVTQGIFVNMVQADPELVGISAVLFDEVHERSLDGDFGLALARDVQAALRPDLRLVAMSATLEGPRFSALLGGAPVIESEGRGFPIELRHLGRSAQRIEDDMAAAIRRALAETDGGVLAFLPGVAEIERTAERVEGGLPADVVLHRLYGTLDPAAQRAAIRAEPAGRRKLVLATAIAETSLTLDGVAVVVDSGLARRPRYDRAAGMTRLATERVSQAAATQRAGRAGRQRPGVAYRLWEAAATAGLAPYDPPEIAEADLSGLVLACAIWGVTDPGALAWIDPPSAPAVAEAKRRLEGFGLIDADGRPTAHGKAVATLPLAPRLGHMLVAAGAQGMGGSAAEVAVLLSEQGLGGPDPDLETRLRRWRQDNGKRAEGARGLARRWAQAAKAGSGQGPLSACVALAFPDRVAKRRGADGADWIAAGGRGFRLDPTSALARAEWLAVAETQGAAAGARIVSAAPIAPDEIDSLFAERIETVTTLAFDPATGTATATRERRLGAIRLARGPAPDPDRAALAAALVEGVRAHGLDLLPWGDAARALRLRAGFVGIDALADKALVARLDEWLPSLVEGRRRLSDVPPGALHAALEGLLGWDGKRRLDAEAPAHFTSPLGTTYAIDYAAEGGPAVELRVQALFGLAAHPMIGHTPLVLRLTSPAGRSIQTTRDLPGFWAGSWAAVAKEMRGRYPRHPWPDDPAAAAPTLRTKRASS
ncbi:ATP-dependent helicase HrpB [Sphingomonas nostoxanthinifaciens]|uniref:ATP-dependent helicase HrpB n=1 Tax=Sphingomonas nostoxanthinifaciens TaxID=2872652 RepID=UPI001CC1C959|nr:ATP-dependent helicase HrpB [Sphingomonas nostoxanthinifaciens]UAK25054.1 ATP-dependent helicase HrpB [Sphingomonas nostoxanthinifaciens]